VALPDPCDVYLDIETRRSPRGAPDFVRGYPPPLPFFELWQDDDPPKVRTPDEVKAGNRKGETREKYIAEQVAKDEAALAAWRLESNRRYNALQEERARKVAELDEATSMDAFQGGEVGMIGLILGEGGNAKLIHPHNDPELPDDRRIAYLAPPVDSITKRLELHRLAEFRNLQRLSQGLQRAAWAGRDREQGQRARELRIHAWGGWDFDFQFIAVRAALLARFENAYANPHDETPHLDRDLVWLASRFWHTVPWKSPGLYDPRDVWSFGKRSRFARGRLVHVAEFFGDEVPAWYRAFHHRRIPELLESPGHPYAGSDQPEITAWAQPPERLSNLDVTGHVCRLDVECLRYVHGVFMETGVWTASS